MKPAGWRYVPPLFVFVVSLVVYVLTLEPSVPWWDCGEFIAASARLEVGHPPGAPLFLLLGRFFSLFASDPGRIAFMINLMSAMASAATVMFLYWTIVLLAEKRRSGVGMSTGVGVSRITRHALRVEEIAGVVGSLTYAFTDTFWFSAVEGEVYALSSLFTAVVFWAILRWERETDQPGSMRWILLIAYLTGLSIGVHLLNLLAIPAIVLIWHYKKHPEPDWKGTVKAFTASLLILAFIMYGLIPGVPLLASWFELFFVNLFGLPYGAGVLVFLVMLVVAMVWGIRETRRRGSVTGHTVLLSLALILIGYSSYALILIRASGDPPMNQTRPDNVFALLSYLNREQYGDRPLLYGPAYVASPVDQKPGKPIYGQVDGKYRVVDHQWKPVYDRKLNMLFPRMWKNSPEHVRIYTEWGRVKSKPVRVTGPDGSVKTVNKPTFGENLRFFFGYQVGHMYLRYFMWNFVGRQNDTESQGGFRNGNWISGMGFVDSWRLGSQEQLPGAVRNHPSRNTYYFLPLLLGLAGAWWQFRRDRRRFWVILTLFAFTGIAIVVYLNQYPNQPRERDYSYAGSFYAFAIWIGLSVTGLVGYGIRDVGYRILGKSSIPNPESKITRHATRVTRHASQISLVLVLLTLAVPILLLAQNFDDHDRSNRYIARDFAYNYLNSCAPNAILFTNGDNDTFPLWYAQEVEGIRRDVRVVCLPYLAADWYIDQLKKQAYESEPLPFSLTRDQYGPGRNDYLPVFERINEVVELKEVMDFIRSDHPDSKLPLEDGSRLGYLPVTRLKMSVDKQKILLTGTVPPEEADRIVPEMSWKINRGSLYKNDLMILDLIATNEWERPVYFTSIMHSNILGLQQYFRLEGFAYCLVPIPSGDQSGYSANINTSILYDRLMNTFRWGNIDNPDVFIDYNTYRTTLVLRLRKQFAELAGQLLSEGRRDSALQVLHRAEEVLAPPRFPNDVYTPALAEVYFQAGDYSAGNRLLLDYAEDIRQDLAYIIGLEKSAGSLQDEEAGQELTILTEMIRLLEQYEQAEPAARIGQMINQLMETGS